MNYNDLSYEEQLAIDNNKRVEFRKSRIDNYLDLLINHVSNENDFNADIVYLYEDLTDLINLCRPRCMMRHALKNKERDK